MQKLERIHLLSRTDMLKPLRLFVRNVAVKQNCCKDNVECLVMAVNEACMNVIQHGYKYRDNEEIIVEFWEDNKELIIKVIDNAQSADTGDIKSRDLDDVRPGGLGVHIIQQVMDCVEYKSGDGSADGKGNLLEMRKQITNEKKSENENNAVVNNAEKE